MIDHLPVTIYHPPSVFHNHKITNSMTTFTNLPNDIHLHILSFLDLEQRTHLSLTSRRFYIFHPPMPLFKDCSFWDMAWSRPVHTSWDHAEYNRIHQRWFKRIARAERLLPLLNEIIQSAQRLSQSPDQKLPPQNPSHLEQCIGCTYFKTPSDTWLRGKECIKALNNVKVDGFPGNFGCSDPDRKDGYDFWNDVHEVFVHEISVHQILADGRFCDLCVPEWNKLAPNLEYEMCNNAMRSMYG